MIDCRYPSDFFALHTGRQLWAQRFDQPFTDIFDVQDAIAMRIADALALRTSGRNSPELRRETRDPEAYSLYASGRFAFTRLTEATLLQAIDFYERAVGRDPAYALAYAGLADSYSLLAVIGSRAPREVFPLARAAADRSLSLDPQLAAAYTARAQIRVVYDLDAQGALEDLDRAAAIDPNLPSIYFYRGVIFSAQGNLEGSRESFCTRSDSSCRTLTARGRSAFADVHASL